MDNTSIVICGQKFDIGTKVILWNESNGLNAYNESAYKTQDRKTGKIITISGKRYGVRSILKPDLTIEQLKPMIKQFFLHHTGCRDAKTTYDVLQKERGLSVSFILGDNGDLFQTLDIKEKSWHGGVNNPISIGIEICSRASATQFPNDYDTYHQQQYHVLPRRKRIDKVQGMTVLGYEYNDKQYFALIKLATKLCEIFPNLNNADFPRTISGKVIESILPKPLNHVGFICHYHNAIDKWDPVCMDHQRLLNGIKNYGTDAGCTFIDFSLTVTKQKALTKLGYNIGAVDNIWGPKCIAGLQHFQTDNKIKVTGLWDPLTDYIMDNLIKTKNIIL